MRFLFYIFFVSASFLTAAVSPAFAGDWPHRDQLRCEIRFWKDIFTRYDDDSIVLHDPHDLSLVYTTISLSPAESNARREQRIRAAKYEVENSLRSLADSMAAGRGLTAQEKKLYQLFGASATPQQVKICASRIRAQQGISNRFYEGLERSTAYMPALKKIFRDKGLPEELAYLPHIESSFNPTARSKVGAAGMWQFMKPTAKTFSLKTNSIIDERYDPLAASEAAASLLKTNYSELADWGLALTAYNYGLGGMTDAAQRCGGNYVSVRKNYCSPRFQFASKNFYPEFLAAVEIMEKPEAYFPGYSPRNRNTIVQHRLQKPTTLPALAKTWGIELSRLRELNPGYSKKAYDGRLTIPAGYTVNISRGLAAQSQQGAAAETKPAAKAVIEAPAGQAVHGEVVEHKPAAKAPPALAAGHTAGGQIKKEKTPAVADSRSQQKVSEQPAPSAAKDGKAEAAGSLSLESLRREIAPVLDVHEGSIKIFGDETLGHVARWLKLSPQKLCSLNKIKPTTNLRQRQKLLLDFSLVSEAEFTQARLAYHLSAIESMLRKHNLEQLIEYRMSSSDSLQQLASRQFKIPASLIVYFNSGQNLNSLSPGSVIRIPVSREAALHIL